MIEMDDLSVEEIMERIRRKLETQRETLKKEQLRPSEKEQFEADLAKETYEMEDFLKYHDKDFIYFAYKAILKREPDPSGYNNYLFKLRNGELDKVDIVVSLCKSLEGRAKGTKVKNINFYYIKCGIKRIPIISYFLKWLNLFLKLPKVIKNLETENKYYYGNLREDIDQINKEVQVRLEKLNYTYDHLSGGVSEITNKIRGIETKLNDLSYKVTEEDKEVLNRLADLELKSSEVVDKLKELEVKEIPEILEADKESYLSRAISSSHLSHPELTQKGQDKDVFFYLFENVFRGEQKDIKERQRYYLKYVLEVAKNTQGEIFLDAGCGRGEFLELLQENNIPYLGIEINEFETNFLKQKGLNVKNSDILEYLSNTNKNLMGISCFQVIEHLDITYLKKFIELAYKRIAEHGIIILESVNPHCPFALSRFYVDLTHIRPYPPETIKFLLEWYGFREVKIIFSAPVTENIRSRELCMNYQDYAVIGRKI